MRPNPWEIAELVIFTEEILKEKHHFLCSDYGFRIARLTKVKPLCSLFLEILAIFSYLYKVKLFLRKGSPKMKVKAKEKRENCEVIERKAT